MGWWTDTVNWTTDTVNWTGDRFSDTGDWLGDRWNDVSGVTASRNAAKAQVKGADAATALQREMFEKSIELNEPWRQAGMGALSDLSSGLKSGAFESAPQEFDASRYQDPTFKFNFQADPGYQFRLQQAQKAVERGAAARGGLFSGATMRSTGDTVGQLASEEFGRAYGRARGEFESDRTAGQQNRNFAYGVFSDSQGRKRQGLNDRFDRLSALAGLGNNAAGRGMDASARFGDAASSNILGAANARAAGYVGAYNNQRDTLMGLASLGAKLYAAGG